MTAQTFYDLNGKIARAWHKAKWADQAQDIASWLADDTDPDEIDVLDVYWGGEHGDDNTIDAVVVYREVWDRAKGRHMPCSPELIGSFGRSILPDELPLVERAVQERMAEIDARARQ